MRPWRCRRASACTGSPACSCGRIRLLRLHFTHRADDAVEMGGHGAFGGGRVARGDGLDDREVLSERNARPPGLEREGELLAHALPAQPLDERQRCTLATDLMD